MKPSSPLVLGSILAALSVAGLPGCGDKEDSSATDDTEKTVDSPVDTSEALDRADYPQCDDPPDTGWVGACCTDIYCTARTGDSCPEAASVDAQDLTGKSLGSGECQCSSVEGPFQVIGEDGCCYTVGIQGCEGRPLRVAGLQRVAGLRRGAGWAREA